MTKEEFVARQRASKRIENRYGSIAVALLFVSLFGSAAVADRLKSHPANLQGPFLYGYGLFMLLCAIGIAVPVILSGRSYRKQGMVCPACGKPLTHIAAQIAVASGHCGYCGAAVYDSSPA